MGKTRHDNVIRVLYQICKDYPPYIKVYADHIGEKYHPIDLVQVIKRREAVTYAYEPDVWCKTKNGKIDVYEIWDSETDENCVEDIIFSAVTKGINYLSIICFTKEDTGKAKALSNIILCSIHNEEGEYLLNPRGYVLIALVQQELLNNENGLREFLKKQLKFI